RLQRLWRHVLGQHFIRLSEGVPRRQNTEPALGSPGHGGSAANPQERAAGEVCPRRPVRVTAAGVRHSPALPPGAEAVTSKRTTSSTRTGISWNSDDSICLCLGVSSSWPVAFSPGDDVSRTAVTGPSFTRLSLASRLARISASATALPYASSSSL